MSNVCLKSGSMEFRCSVNCSNYSLFKIVSAGVDCKTAPYFATSSKIGVLSGFGREVAKWENGTRKE